MKISLSICVFLEDRCGKTGFWFGSNRSLYTIRMSRETNSDLWSSLPPLPSIRSNASRSADQRTPPASPGAFACTRMYLVRVCKALVRSERSLLLRVATSAFGMRARWKDTIWWLTKSVFTTAFDHPSFNCIMTRKRSGSWGKMWKFYSPLLKISISVNSCEVYFSIC